MTDPDLVHDALSAVFEEHEEPFTVVHGGARGADRFAGDWAKLMRRYGVREEVHNANWHEHGRAAGPIRNQEMVDAGADLVLAFYREGSKNIGTQNCVDKATLARIPIRRYTQP